jgi:glycosyltransferase involved in cell wall biosynthesis
MVPVDAALVDPIGEPFAKLSVFYPMWNEEEYVERALVAGRRACERLVHNGDIGDYELIVVDDASTDRTAEIADRLAAQDPRVVVVHHARNRKLGGAMKTGFATATGDVILYTDADLPFDMAELPRAVRLLREYDVDIVSAYRFDRTGEGYLRSVYTFAYNLLIRTLFGVKARDINFAFKLCRASVFEHVELRSEGSFIDAELVIRATRLGYEMLQFGVDYYPRTRGVSTLSSPSVITTILKEMWELRHDLEGIEPLVDKR